MILSIDITHRFVKDNAMSKVESEAARTLGQKGGKKRWEGVSDGERSAHMSQVVSARWEKYFKKKEQDAKTQKP